MTFRTEFSGVRQPRYYEGVSNGYLAELYGAVTGQRVEVVGETVDLHPCPCCHLKTLHERHNVELGTGYDICPSCDWEDDGTSDPSVRSGPNAGSMEDYRARVRSDPNYFYRARWRVSER